MFLSHTDFLFSLYLKAIKTKINTHKDKRSEISRSRPQKNGMIGNYSFYKVTEVITGQE